MNNNHDDKKEKEEEIFFNNLFEKKEKDQNEQLYKNEFYVLEEEMKVNKDQNSLQFMHDALLNKLMLEDYSPFPPKNEEPTIVNNQKEEKKKEDEQDKLIEEENEFLRSLHRINYLTFSPFGLSFFDENNKDNQNLSEEILKEKESKILHMIDFDYNNFEVTNDLLLNICQGFVDINKLKEENLTANKTIIVQNQAGARDNNQNSTNLINDLGNIPIKEKKESEKDEESEDELNENVNKKRKIEFYQEIINKFDKEMENVDKKEKKELIKKWKNTFKDKDKEYEEYLKKLKEEEKKRKQEEKKLKDIENKKKKEMEEKIKSENLFKKGMESIIRKAKKKGVISNSAGKVKIKPKVKKEEKEGIKKTLNNSILSNKNVGNSSFISKKGLNKSLMSSRRKKSENSLNKKK